MCRIGMHGEEGRGNSVPSLGNAPVFIPLFHELNSKSSFSLSKAQGTRDTRFPVISTAVSMGLSWVQRTRAR